MRNLFKFVAAEFPKNPSPKPARIHSPDPFLRAGKFSRGFAKSFPPENSFGKSESAFRPATHCLETSRAELQKKNTLSFFKRIPPRLADAYLNEALEFVEYQTRKNALMSEKKTLEEKLSDFERKGNHWLELMRNWIIEANQAENLSKQENPSR